MKRKTWACLCLAALTGAIVLLSALVIAIDPFQVYRLATHYVPPIDNTTQVYANAGIVRSYDYDSAIVGTSVTENFRPSQMDEVLGGRFIKLCTPPAPRTTTRCCLISRLRRTTCSASSTAWTCTP